MLISVLKVVAVSIGIGTIYASCTGLHGISFALISPESYVRYRKVKMWSFETFQSSRLIRITVFIRRYSPHPLCLWYDENICHPLL